MMRRSRKGFALLTVLWAMNLAGLIAVVALRSGRQSFDATANRVGRSRGYWGAVGCLRQSQAVADSLLARPSLADRALAWRRLGTLLTDVSAPSCQMEFEAAGTRLDVNSATAEQLERALAELGMAGSAVAAAIVRARDSLAFTDLRQLGAVVGESLPLGLETLLSVEPGVVCLATADAAVLATVPGIAPQLARVIVERQNAGAPPSDLVELIGAVDAQTEGELLARFPEAGRLSTPDPVAWVVRATSRAPSGLTTTVVTRWEIVENRVHVARLEVAR